MAQIVFVGALGKDPELKTSQDGNRVYTRLSVAWSERTKTRDGQWENGPTVWVSVACFGRQAENVAASLHKGDRVVVAGRIRPERWSSQRGEQTVMTVTADHVAPELTFAHAEVQRGEKRGGQPVSQAQVWGQPEGGFTGHSDDDQPPF